MAPSSPPVVEAAPPPAPAPVDTLSDDELRKLAEQEAKEEVITVTGSTIERKTLTTPAPLTILNRDDLSAAGRSTVGDILQQLPAQSNAVNAQVNNGGTGTTRINIRGLGAARTLTLLNGRRVVPGGTGANDSVDLNSIPLAVIERVEVLKDGASAIYGSDAVGGVVNIITRNDFSGNEAAFYTGGSPKGDGFTYDASFVTGHNSENRKGNIIFSAGLQNQDPVFAGDRSFSNRLRSFDFANRAETTGNITTAPSGYLNAKAGIDLNGDGKGDVTSTCGDGVEFCASRGTDPRAEGFRPFETTDLYNPQPSNYLYTPSSRYNVYTAGTYQFSEPIRAFFEASYLKRNSDQVLAPTPFDSAAVISKDSMYNPLMGDVLIYQRRLTEFGERTSEQNVDTFRIVGGFQGTIPEAITPLADWKWELSYNYGRTDGTLRTGGNLIKSRLATAVGPSFEDTANNNKPTCGTMSKPIAGCVPINILGAEGSIDPASAAWVTFTGISNGFNEQQTVLGNAHGRIVKLPNGGDLSLAVGADYRRESGGFSPDPLVATGDTTGNAARPTAGSYNVVEGYSELSFVPISGQKYAEWVELNAAARAFRYSTFGSDITWKVGGLFRTINGVAALGTYSTAFRAPSVGDLFQGTADSFPSNLDPCNTMGGTIALDSTTREKCDAQGAPADATYAKKQQRTVVGGNPDLIAETAKTLTGGVVFEPPQVKGLSFTADYWRIAITDAIQALPASTVLSNCYVRGLDPFCAQIHRSEAKNFEIDFIDNRTANVGSTKTSGMDYAVGYTHEIPRIGRFREQVEVQHLFQYNVDNNTGKIIHGRGVYDLGVYTKYKANLSSQYLHPSGAGGGFNLRYIGSFRECERNDCNGVRPSREVDAWYKLDLFGSYTLKSVAGTTTLAVGVNNVINALPTVIYAGFAGTSDSATYDYMGRFVYARLSQMF